MTDESGVPKEVEDLPTTKPIEVPDWRDHQELRDLIATIPNDSDRIRAFRLLNEALAFPTEEARDAAARDLEAMAALREHHASCLSIGADGSAWNFKGEQDIAGAILDLAALQGDGDQ